MWTEKCIGFIGTGNMGEALIGGILHNQVFDPDHIWCSDIRQRRLDEMKTRFGIRTSLDNATVIDHANMIVLAVKPQSLSEAANACSAAVDESKLIVSIAAGVPLKILSELFPKTARFIRAMPNMCVTARQGITALVPGAGVSTEDIGLAQTVFDAVGRSIVLKDESLMDAVTGLSGSGPAYIFVILDALADAGVHMGLPREESLLLAAQTILGSAAVYLDTRTHPGQLKDMVTSPAGTTIAGLHALEKGGIRCALRDAVAQATRRSQELGRLMFAKQADR